MKYAVQFYSERPSTKSVDEVGLTLDAANDIYAVQIERFFNDCEMGYDAEICIWGSVFGNYETRLLNYSSDMVRFIDGLPMVLSHPNKTGHNTERTGPSGEKGTPEA